LRVKIEISKKSEAGILKEGAHVKCCIHVTSKQKLDRR
jgi:hypothetical protein